MKRKSNRLFFVVLYCLAPTVLLVISFFLSDAVTAIAENTSLTPRRCIIIDPGHGGEDGGATSCAGVLESKYNLEIALRLNDVMQLMGLNTKMIRTTDKSIYTKGDTIAQKKVSDLKERVSIANNTDNAMLISIHQNYFSDSKYSGAQVFYAPTDSSRDLAQMLQQDISSYLQKTNHRKIKKANGIYLMEHIQCTGVLVECGFLSNDEEEANLRQPDYQKALCCVITASVSNFLDRNDVS